jgi:hypothetical protein
MSKSYEEIFSDSFERMQELQEERVTIERSRIVNYLQIRIDHHFGCRGSKYCEQCILLRQVINFVNEED